MATHRKPDPTSYTHAFCLTRSVWNIIKNYAIEQEISYSASVRELVLIGYEKLKNDRRAGM